MSDKLRLYLYPYTNFGRYEGANSYIDRLKETLDIPFRVINERTDRGMVHLLRSLPRTDIVYFNWIEDLADKRYGYLQILLLAVILVYCRIAGKQVVWFVHNNTSHSRTHWAGKRFTAWMMRRFANTVLAHAEEARATAQRHVAVFDHPVADFSPVPDLAPRWDLLLWGSVSPYKGVLEFVRLHAARPELRELRVLVAGRFSSAELFEAVRAAAHPNVSIRNEIIPDADLFQLVAQSRYVLFSYVSPSVLASAALSQTVAYGKTIIGPDRGAFRSLARQGLVHTFRDEDDLCALLMRLRSEPPVDPDALRSYAERHTWAHFGAFLQEQLHACRTRPAWRFVLR
ncbi:MAG: hypothetical protein EOO15_16605 [Chitinophagaceae bacterium]|nr:MAG: hypothetical protein EOO15_16605 [Chitinophagaceae bacterium]